MCNCTLGFVCGLLITESRGQMWEEMGGERVWQMWGCERVGKCGRWHEKTFVIIPYTL